MKRRLLLAASPAGLVLFGERGTRLAIRKDEIVRASIGTSSVMLLRRCAVIGRAGKPDCYLAFLEGPTVDLSGVVYFVNTRMAQILTWNPARHALDVFRERSGGANGLILDREGRYTCPECRKTQTFAPGLHPDAP